MILKKGEKVYVISKRNFEMDIRRHFIGEVEESLDTAVRLKGYAYVFNAVKNQYLKIGETRTRIISLVDANNIINILPQGANIEKAVHSTSDEKRLVVTDGETFSLDINEFGTNR